MGNAFAAITDVANRYGSNDPITIALRRLDDKPSGAAAQEIGFHVLNVAALSALDTTALLMVSGANVRVLSLKAQWDLDVSDTTTPADGITVALATPSGRWHRRQTPDPYWQAQTVWGVDSLAGNDENPGTALSPIRTMAEFVRRVGTIFEPAASVLVTARGAISQFSMVVVSHGPTLTIRGVLPTPTADVVAAVQLPDAATQKEPRVTLTTGWAGFPKKANLLSFPNAATPCWAFATDNDGALVTQTTFPIDASVLPLWTPAPMPAPGDAALIYAGEAMVTLSEASLIGLSTEGSLPAVVLETLSITRSRFEAAVLLSRCRWDSPDSSIECTGNLIQFVAVAQEATDGASYSLPIFAGFLLGSSFRNITAGNSGLVILESIFNRLTAVGSDVIAYTMVISETLAGVGGEYLTFLTNTRVNFALWGTALSDVTLGENASVFVAGGATINSFNPMTLTVGIGGTPIPPLVPGLPVPGTGALTTSAELRAGPFNGEAIEYTKNCRVTSA